MSTPTLTLTLRQFVARKGFPETFISDNFKSFNSVIVNKFLRNNKTDWKFILDGSTWWGGFYKRLVKVVKDSLLKVVKNARLNYDEVITVLIEIEFNEFITARGKHWPFDESSEIYSAVTEALLETILL